MDEREPWMNSHIPGEIEILAENLEINRELKNPTLTLEGSLEKKTLR